jgi:THAP domain
MSYCCVPCCTGRGGHRFPVDRELRAKWSVAVRRQALKVTTHTVVCREHFRAEDYRVDVNFQGSYFVSDNIVVHFILLRSICLHE